MYRLFVLIPLIMNGCFEVNLDQRGQDPPWLASTSLGAKMADRDALVRSPDTTLVNLRRIGKTVEILTEARMGMGGLDIAPSPTLDDAQMHTRSLDWHLADFRDAVDGQISFIVEDVSLLTLPVRTPDISARPLGEFLHEFLKQNECEFVILSSGDVLIRKSPSRIGTPGETGAVIAGQHTAASSVPREAVESSAEKSR